jgi:hypothetical protein
MNGKSARICKWPRHIAQAVSRRLPTTAARVRARFRSCGIYGERSGIKAGFLRVLRFPLTIFILSCYNRTYSDRRTKWIPSHPAARKLKKRICKEETMAFFKADYPRMGAIVLEGAVKLFSKRNKLLMV